MIYKEKNEAVYHITSRGNARQNVYLDFSKAEQGKFYRPIEELDIPIYLDNEVKIFLVKKL